eukprot:2113302-Pyramimonas_sp.AAC.1
MQEDDPWRASRPTVAAPPAPSSGQPATSSYLQRADLDATEQRIQQTLKRQMEEVTKAMQST